MVEMILQVVAQVLAALVVLARGSKPTKKFPAVTGFDINRFLGRWYVAAWIPAPYQRNRVSISTEYSRDEGGGIRVSNRHYNKRKKKWVTKESAARFKSEEDVGWLIVETGSLLERDRKIIYLSEDYSQAIIVGLTMRTIWIAYRDPNLTERELDTLFHRAEDLGFKTRSLVRVDHYEDWQREAASKISDTD